MRCSYCGGLNPDSASFCARCGRDLSRRPPSAQPVSQPPSPSQPLQRPPYPQPLRPPQSITTVQASPNQPSQRPSYPLPSRPPVSSGQAVSSPGSASRPVRVAQPAPQTRVAPVVTKPEEQVVPVPPAVPLPNIQFPPRTIAQLRMLEPGALAYSVLDDTVLYGRRRVVRIAFQRCEPWRQIATLLKAADAFRSSTYETLVLYGRITGSDDVYQYTNGMLQFDQKVRLGSQLVNRYQIETGTGLAIDSLRIVLNE